MFFPKACRQLEDHVPCPISCSPSSGAWDRAPLIEDVPEHLSNPLWLFPCQGRYFLVRDVAEKMDVLGTVRSCGAPNFRQVRGGLTVFGMGQPSLSGFRRVLQKLQKDGHRVSRTVSGQGLAAPQIWQRGSSREWPGHMMGRVPGDPDQALQALNATVIIVVSMVGKFWVNFYFPVVCGHGGLRSEAPYTPHFENLGEVRRGTG